MYYTIYKITNNINGKFYIGKHQTDDLNDKYFGSGKILKHAIKKYGIENFTKEILEVYNTEPKMNLAEKILVVTDLDISYNMCKGGYGGFSWINSNMEYFNKKRIDTWFNKDINTRMRINKLKSRIGKDNGMYGIHRYGEDAPTYGKKMKDETKDKIREANLGRIIPEEQIKKMSISQIKRWKDPNLKNERSVKYKELGIRPPSPKGLLWWNNDKICKRAKDKPGEDFKLGRLINVTKTK